MISSLLEPKKRLINIGKQPRGAFEVKGKTVGASEILGRAKEARVLNRVALVAQDYWEYEADQHHFKPIVRDLCL